MKRIALIVLTATLVRAEPPYTMSLTTASSKVCASRVIAPSEATPFTTAATTFTQGEYVSQSNLLYMCTVGGTITNGVLGITSGEKTTGTATFRHIPTGSTGKVIPRIAASIQLVSGGNVSICVGADAVASRGEMLTAAGAQWTPGPNVTQQDVRAISASTSVIAILEVVKD